MTFLNYRDACGISDKYAAYEKWLAEVKVEADGHARARSKACEDYQLAANKVKAMEAKESGLKSLIGERDSTHAHIVVSLTSKYEDEKNELVAKLAKEIARTKTWAVEEYEKSVEYAEHT